MQADFVIIGSGSAGSAMAYRLSENGKYSVLVLEYGGGDSGPLIQMPAALSYPMNMKRYDWGFKTMPEPHLNGRQLVTPRGKVIGGSSSINGMVFVRGNAADFDHWAAQGATGWGYNDVLPYFKRMEHWHGDKSNGGKSDWRGDSGPLHVTIGPRDNPLHAAFVQAGAQAGFPLTDDYNGKSQEGFGPMEQTVWRGRRWSTANAYLKPALRRQNCKILRCFARKVVIKDGRAVGVEVERRGQIEMITAGREVIIAASAINSPKILMLSGVGPAAHLSAHGIDVVVDRAGVGQNLQDHLELYIQQASLQPITLYKHWNLFSKAAIGARWLFLKSGLGASNQFESAAFVRSPGAEYPDIQYHFLPIAVRYDGQISPQGHGFQAHVGPMRSKSRGAVTLASADPNVAPEIRFNYMSHTDDWAEFRHCIRLTRRIFAQEAFKPFAGDEIQPGDDLQTDDELDDFIRGDVESAFHPCGTVRMGAVDDPGAVVDPKCRVIGVDGLRVADSSVFPRIPNGNLNGPSIMVGEKVADHILNQD